MLPADWTPLQRLRYLLDHWGLIFDPDVTSPSGVWAGDGDGVPLMPKMASHPSVVELQRCLELLRSERYSWYCHLKAYRCAAEWRQVRATVEFRGPTGKLLKGDGWKMERIVPAWVDPRRVLAAERFLLKHFRGQVFIPDEVLECGRKEAA